MPRTVTDIDVLQEYIAGVMDRAAHHAGAVEEISLAIAGAIVWRKDGPIRVYEREGREGRMTNALWMTIGGQRYFLSYHHESQSIRIHEENMQGRVLAAFSNATPIADVKAFFQNL